MSTLTLRIPPELDIALTTFAAEIGVSKSDVARQALQRHVMTQKWDALRAHFVPQAQAMGIFTDEDVFAMVS